MLSLIFTALSSLVPNLSWDVRPVHYSVMKSTLSAWREDYDKSSYEYKSSFEMIGWYATTMHNKGCFGMYHNNNLRALSQVYQSGSDVCLRSVLTPKGEDIAGTILMYKILEFDIKVDCEAMRQNPRWHIAALFISLNKTFFL